MSNDKDFDRFLDSILKPGNPTPKQADQVIQDRYKQVTAEVMAMGLTEFETRVIWHIVRSVMHQGLARDIPERSQRLMQNQTEQLLIEVSREIERRLQIPARAVEPVLEHVIDLMDTALHVSYTEAKMAREAAKK